MFKHQIVRSGGYYHLYLKSDTASDNSYQLLFGVYTNFADVDTVVDMLVRCKQLSSPF